MKVLCNPWPPHHGACTNTISQTAVPLSFRKLLARSGNLVMAHFQHITVDFKRAVKTYCSAPVTEVNHQVLSSEREIFVF